ncbi:MAG: cysteine peptidase family C39 domain-containing protein, partial [Xenococcaceae cyanobacterium]
MPLKKPKLFGNKNIRRRTPTLLQMEAVECGAAALGIILSYYGRIVPLTQLRQDCGVSRDGSKASNVLSAARSYGMSAKGLKTDVDALRALQCPYIVFWNFNHFLVVEGFSQDRVFLNDPATGSRTVTLEEFNHAYTGVVLVMEPGAEFQKGGKNPSVIDSLWQRLRGSLGVLSYCMFAGLLLVIPGLAMPTFSQVFVDNILIEKQSEWLRPLIIGMVVTAAVTALLTLLQLQFLRRMKIKLSIGMSSQFLWHILRLPVSFYDQRFAGEISSRVNLNDSLAEILSGKLATTAIAALTVVFYGIVMFQYDVILTLIGIAFIALNLFALQWVSRQRVDANMRLQQDEGKVSGVAISGLQSMETLKASGLESDFFARWAGYHAKAMNSQQTMEVTNQTLGVLPSFLSDLSSMLLLTVGGLRVMTGALSIGMLVAFQTLMRQFLEPVNQLVNLGNDLQEMEGALTRLDDVLRNPIDPQVNEKQGGLGGQGSKAAEENNNGSVPSIHHPAAIATASPKLQGYVELRNITFGYNRIGRPLIENFSLSLKPGQRVALVGGSGSGKSTISKMICGLYEPWSGEILF